MRHSDERMRQWSTARRLVSMVVSMGSHYAAVKPPRKRSSRVADALSSMRDSDGGRCLWRTTDAFPRILTMSKDGASASRHLSSVHHSSGACRRINASRLRGSEFRRLSKGKYVDATRRPSAVLD